jgi:hypothetical protein
VSDLAVVHLVRAANGEDPLERFLHSYREHPAGVEHDLVLLLKGFGPEHDSSRPLALAADVCSRTLAVSDAGYDIGAYSVAAHRLPHRTLCFVNSFSAILVDGWLELLASALEQPGVGIAGASGSWESHLSQMQFDLGLGGPYAAVHDDRRAVQAQMRARASGAGASEPSGTSEPTRTLRGMLRTSRDVSKRLTYFGPFPSPHVRTNGFALRAEALRMVKLGRQRDKFDAYRVEAGRRSLTRQVEAMGLRPVLVGRDGHRYETRDWPASATFCQRDQENLMIADNQTRAYAEGDVERRTVMSRFAWGPAAEPSRRDAQSLDPSASREGRGSEQAET